MQTMQAFSSGARKPESLLDVKSQQPCWTFKMFGIWGKGAGRGIFLSHSLPSSFFRFSFALMPTPLVALSTLPNLPLLLIFKMAAICAQTK